MNVKSHPRFSHSLTIGERQLRSLRDATAFIWIGLFALLAGLAGEQHFALAADSTESKTTQEEVAWPDAQMIQSQHAFRRGHLLIKPTPQDVGINPLDVYRSKKRILHKSIQFDRMWLGFPYFGKRAKASRTFDGGRDDFISKKSRPRKEPFVDFNADGIPDLIIVESVGNAGNRYTMYSLGEKAKLLGSIMAIRSDAQFMDCDKDGRIETLTYDPTFFGWKTCNAESATPFVILRLNVRRFVLDTSLMRAKPPDLARQKELLADWSNGGRDEFSRSNKSEREEGYDKKTFYLAPVVWRDMLDLIYSGNSLTAFHLLDRFWGQGRYAGNLESGEHCEVVHTSKEKFVTMFLEQLAHSPYLDEIKKLNYNDARFKRLRQRAPLNTP